MLTQPLDLPAIPFADPFAQDLLGDHEPASSLGVFVHARSLGFIDPATIAETYTVLRGILGGHGDSNSIKTIYQQIPQSMIRVTGGHGTWTDTVTGETMPDLQTEVRKVAMMASALGIYNDKRNWFFDDTTGQQLTPGAVLARWEHLFGNGTTFQAAYARAPELFRVFGSDPALDPIIPDIGGGPLPPNLRSGAQFTGAQPLSPLQNPVGAPGVTGGGASTSTHPLTVAGLSPAVIGIAIGAAVLLTVMSAKKRR